MTYKIFYYILKPKLMKALDQHYADYHFKQLQSMFKKGYHSQLVLSAHVPPSYRIPSLISCRMFEQAALQSFESQEQLNIPINIIWLVVSSYMIGMDYEQYETQLTTQHGEKYKQMIEDWFKISKPLSHPPEIKSMFRSKFEELLQKSSQQNYFALAKMPVFLISTQWLQDFYSSSGSYIGAVDNLSLHQPMKYIDTDPSTMHLNYRIKKNLRQNTDYKIIAYEPWMYLKQNFGGVQFRRFNTNERQPSCQIYLKNLKIFLVSGRYVVGNQPIELLASKNDTFSTIVNRLKRITIAYGLLSFDTLKQAVWEIVKTTNLAEQNIFDILHSQEKQLSQNYKDFSQNCKIQRLELQHDLEEAEYYSETDYLIINLNTFPKIPSSIKMNQIPIKKSTKIKEQCRTCQKTEDLIECVCKSAYFCSKACKSKNKEHQKQCRDLTRQQSRLNSLFDLYGIRKRTFNYDDLKKRGKVGLQNLGNTCYMNAALQCVTSMDFLAKYLLSNEHVYDINPNNVLGSQGHLVCAYGQFMKDYYSLNRRCLEPIKILRIIAKNPQFRGHNHQDSQEFLNYFLDKLHQDLNLIKKKPYLEDVESNGRPDDIVSQQSWENYLKRNKSFLSQHLAGQYRSQISCPDCNKISITFDPYMSVTLPFPKQEKTFQLTGYYLYPTGEFKKVSDKVIASKNSQKFVQSYFNQPVYCLWLKNKKLYKSWKMEKSLWYNNQEKGILMFYPKNKGKQIEIHTIIQGFDTLARIFFTEKIDNLEKLKEFLYLSIKMPLLKAGEEGLVQLSNDQYLDLAKQANFLKIVNQEDLEFPMTEQKYQIKMKIQFQEQSKIKPKQKIKFDISSGSFKSKSEIKIRSIHQQLTIQSLITAFSEPQQLTEDNTWYCNVCKQHKLAEKKMGIYKTPQYLIIHLKRFNHSGNRYVIYGEKVKTPVKLNEIETINGKQYQLFGYVNHFGSLSFGHYTATVKSQGLWYYCDDSSVKRAHLDGSGAYILFYKQVSKQK